MRQSFLYDNKPPCSRRTVHHKLLFIQFLPSALLCAGFAAWVVLAGKFPEDYRSPYYVSQLLIGGAFTLGALLVTVAAGVTIPALRAMKVQPAIAISGRAHV